MAPLLATGTTGCTRPSDSVSFTIDLTRPADGAAVVLDLHADAGHSTVLSSFVQPPALAVDQVEARQGETTLAVERTLDSRGFEQFRIAPAVTSGPMSLSYVARPGAIEQDGMSGPSGYRFGHLDRDFGAFGARQIFLLPTHPVPQTIDVRLRPPDAWTIVPPWTEPVGRSVTPRDDEAKGIGSERTGTYTLRGPDAAARLLQAVIALGRFESAVSQSGNFSVHVLDAVGGEERRRALDRALALEAHLASHLHAEDRRFRLILFPKNHDGMSISIPQASDTFALSIGPGTATRWLSIGRAIGQAYVADRLAALRRVRPDDAWIQEALPTFLTVGFSESDGWRSRQDWYERFYYNAGGLAMDLRRIDEAPESADQLMREWRGALVLDRLTGRQWPLPARVVETLASGVAPKELHERVDALLVPRPHAIPFPGEGEAAEPVALDMPPLADGSRLGRVDLYLGGRSLGLLEQCGCRARQMGGMARRTSVLRERLRSGTPAVAVELGDVVPFDQHAPGLDRQKEVESDLAFELIAGSGTAVSTIGYSELAYGTDFLRARLRSVRGRLRIASANVRAPGFQLPATYSASVGGINVRLVGVLDAATYHLGRALEYEDATAGITVADPAMAVQEALRGVPLGTLTIVAGPIGPSSVLAIQRAVPNLSLLITDNYFHFDQDPRIVLPQSTHEFASAGFLGRTLIVILRSDAYGLVHLRLAVEDGRVSGMDIEDLPLDEKVPDAPDVRARLDAHYASLVAEAGLAAPPPLGRMLRERLSASYIGAVSCEPCHPAETRQWRTTAHSEAFATMLSTRRQGVPGCYACHVTGYGQPDGYRSMADYGLRHVQCEACHGPAGRHILSPEKENIVRTPTAAVCRECHNQKHSDMTDENFGDYWSRIVHTSVTAASGRDGSRGE